MSSKNVGATTDTGNTPEQRARAIVLRQLSVPKTRWQLERKLAEREVPQDVASQLLDRFEELGLIDDAAFARLWVDSRSRSRSLSRTALRRELTEKGVPAADVEAALEQLSEEDELESARALVRRRIPDDVGEQDRAGREKVVRRLVGMLGRKGYSSGLAFRIVSDECENAAAEHSGW